VPAHSAIKNLIDRELYRIRGFLHPVDAMLFANLLSGQTANGVTGGVCEIGVFYGRSLVLMATALADEHERALGIDLFDIGRGSQLADVQAALTRHDVERKCTLLQRSSLDLSPDDITSVVGGVRFFSIDGGHERHHVDHDSALALSCLANEGIIAFDDFFNPLYPDVTVAVMDFVRKHPTEVAPFCLSRGKLYVCRSSHYADYLDLARKSSMWASVELQSFDFLGRKIAYFTQSIVNRAFYQKSAERGLGSIGHYFTRPPPARHVRGGM
jgi:predicted O-methyltransferase YrrM